MRAFQTSNQCVLNSVLQCFILTVLFTPFCLCLVCEVWRGYQFSQWWGGRPQNTQWLLSKDGVNNANVSEVEPHPALSAFIQNHPTLRTHTIFFLLIQGHTVMSLPVFMGLHWFLHDSNVWICLYVSYEALFLVAYVFESLDDFKTHHSITVLHSWLGTDVHFSFLAQGSGFHMQASLLIILE